MVAAEAKVSGPNGCYQHPPALTTGTLAEKGHVMAEGQSTVTYRAVPGFPGYRVGDDGSVWAIGIVRRRNLRMKFQMGDNGYLTVTLRRDGRQCRQAVHVLILTAFGGTRPEGKWALHRDGIKANNRADNLYWGTPVENSADSDRHGTMPRGHRSGTAKLTDEMVIEMRERYAAGETSTAVMADYPVGRTEFFNIVWGKRWTLVPMPTTSVRRDRHGRPRVSPTSGPSC